jgi:hypothetical protein
MESSIINIVIICVTILIIISILVKYKSPRIIPLKSFNIGENASSIAVNDNFFYTVSKKTLYKYNKKNGKLLSKQSFLFNDINGIQMVNNDLVLVRDKELIWINPQSLEPFDSMDLSFISGKLIWVDWVIDKWWICENTFKGSKIYCFDKDWVPIGLWTVPKSIKDVTGGAIFGEYICITARNEANLLILDIPEKELQCNLIRKIPKCFDDSGFILESSSNGVIYSWGISGGNAVKCRINID